MTDLQSATIPPFTEHVLERKGCPIHYWLGVLEDRPLVVLTHGACVDHRITQPMLLVHGDQDEMGDIRKIAPLWAAREPNCRYEIIPNARHFAILDDPERFNRLLLEFLGQWMPVTPAITQ